MSVCLSVWKRYSVILYIVEQIGGVNNCDYVESNGLYISVYMCMYQMCHYRTPHITGVCV